MQKKTFLLQFLVELRFFYVDIETRTKKLVKNVELVVSVLMLFHCVFLF